MTLPQTSLYIQPHIHMCVLWGYIEAFSKVGILLGKEGALIYEKAHHFKDQNDHLGVSSKLFEHPPLDLQGDSFMPFHSKIF